MTTTPQDPSPYRRPSHYDMPRDPRPVHWTAFRGCEPDCPACEREQEIAERNER